MAASSSSAPAPAPAPEIQPAASSPNDVQITFQVFRKEPHYENFAYVNSKTLKLFPLQLLKKRFLKDNKVAYVAQINDKLVLQIRADNSVPDNHVAINYLHADFLDLLYGEVVRLKSFPIPPPPDLELSTLGLEVEDTGKRPITASHPHITKDFLQQFKGQIFCKEQLLFFEHRGARVHMRVSFATQKAENACRGKLVKQTEIHFFESDLFKVSDQKEVKMILRRDLNIHDLAAEMKSLGVGGFGNELKDVFSMLVVPRFIPQEYAREVRCKYKQGIIFHGPPGTGKTLIARAISKIVNGKLQIVRGPEIFSHFMGSSEAKIRAVFNSAINDLIEKGDKSPLHVIVFDELDSIARERGINPSDTTADRVVNQLLTMIDGYSELSNVLLVGTTNQLELIDKALMRPGRFELHMEIGLPNEAGRKEILRINVKRLQWKGALSSSVNLDELAKETKGFSGAALAALIQTAFFLAVTRAVPENIADTVWADAKVEQEDIDRAFGKLKLTERRG